MSYTYGSESNCKLGNGNSTSYYKCRLGYQVNSQSVANNTSNVTLRLQVKSTNSSYATYGYNQTTKIDGTSLSAKSFDMRDTNTWKTFGERTITITHNADGTYSSSKSGSFSTTATSSYSLKSGSASVTVHPSNIARASKPTLSNSNFEVGSTITIYTNRANSSFTHKAVISCSGYSKTISNIGASTTWNTTSTDDNSKTLYQKITTTNKASGTITLTTYKNGTQTDANKIGTNSISFTANISSGPLLNSYNISCPNTDTLTGFTGMVVKGYSNVVVSNLQSTMQNNATFKKYTFIMDNKTAETTSNAQGTTITINNVASKSGEIRVYDSRGNYGGAFFTSSSMVEYSPIEITDVTLERLNSHGGSEDPSGTATSLSFDGDFWNHSFGAVNNAITSLSVQFKKSVDPDSAYQNVLKSNGSAISLNDLTISSGTFSLPTIDIKGDILNDSTDAEGNTTLYGFNLENSYNIRIIIEDELSSYSYIATLPIGKPYIEITDGGDGEGLVDFKCRVQYSNNGLYSPQKKGVYFDHYGNPVLQENNSDNSCNWNIKDESKNVTFKHTFYTGDTEITGDFIGKGFGRKSGNTTFWMPQILKGSVSITPSAANTPTGKAVTFYKTFSAAPGIFTSLNSAVPGTTALGSGWSGVSTTGVTIYVSRTNTTATSVYWLAVN